MQHAGVKVACDVALYLLETSADGTMLSLSIFSTDSYILPLFMHIASQAIFLVVHKDRLGAPSLICFASGARWAHLGLLHVLPPGRNACTMKAQMASAWDHLRLPDPGQAASTSWHAGSCHLVIWCCQAWVETRRVILATNESLAHTTGFQNPICRATAAGLRSV